MNNVWSAIALRTPCASRQGRPRPLLELFNGYSRYHASARSLAPRVKRESAVTLCQVASRRESKQCLIRAAFDLRSEFTTSSWLTARNRRVARIEKARPPSASKLEPAPSVASHTEGVPDDGGNLTWRDYDPEGGMPLPGGERGQSQINNIFESEDVDTDKGNYILNVMYWRRMSGALIDVGLAFPKDSGVTQDEALNALEYVRSLNVGFDEQAAGQVWAEEESLRLQNELEERAVRLRLYKPNEPEIDGMVEVEPEEEQGTALGRERNQESQIQRIREEHETKSEAEEARKAAAEANAELAAMHTHRGPLELGGGVQPSVELVTYTGRDGIAISRPQTQAWLLPVERKPWVKHYEQQAEILKENSIPQMSLIRRLGPSFLILIFVFGAGMYIVDNYTPPPQSARLWPDVRPSVATLTALTGTMTAFFLLSRFPPFWKTLNKYFTLVPVYPYALSLVGSAFRHDPSHLLINMSSLWLFGLILHEDIGRGAFLSVFFAAGALGAFSSLTYHVLQKAWGTYIFGSSGCVLGVVAAATTLRPNSHIKLFGQEIPVAVWLWLSVWAIAEVVAMRRFKGSIDHVGHLGGLVGGFGAGMWMRQRRQRFQGGVGEETPNHVMKALFSNKTVAMCRSLLLKDKEQI